MAHHVAPDGRIYVDTAFINKTKSVPSTTLEHMGFGEFYVETPKGRVEFDRMRGKAFEGQSGRPHLIYDGGAGIKAGPATKWLVSQMESKGYSEKLAADGPKPGDKVPRNTDLKKSRGLILNALKLIGYPASRAKDLDQDGMDLAMAGDTINEVLLKGAFSGKKTYKQLGDVIRANLTKTAKVTARVAERWKTGGLSTRVADRWETEA